jgi:hypothetical protein
MTTRAKARDLAQEYVTTQPRHAHIWHFRQDELPALPPDHVAVVTIRIRKESEVGLTEQDTKTILDKVRVKDTG